MQPTKSSADVRCSVLQRHFAKVVPLLIFIREHFGIDTAASTSKPSRSLSPEQWKRLNGTLVGVSDLQPAPLANHTQSFSSIHEAVQEAQLQILANASTGQASCVGKSKYDASHNVLLKGYRRPDDRLESFRVTSTGRPGLINLYPNSMVTCLVLEREWHYLCDRIGSERFVWLLVNTSIFVPLLQNGADGSCFVQLTGTALSERAAGKAALAVIDGSVDSNAAAGLKRKHVEMTEAAITESAPAAQRSDPSAMTKRSRPFERADSRISVRSATSAPDLDNARNRTTAGSATAADRKPSEIVLVRSRMFYARSSRNKSGRVEVGLPSVHVLPRSSNKKELDKALPSCTASSSPSSRGKSVTLPSKHDIKSQEAHFHERRTRHLAKYVFPRQFGLHNVFTGARDLNTTTQPFRDYTVREVEIKALGAKRTPKPLRAVLPVLAKILVRHDKLNYRALLDRCCPSRVPKGRLTSQERQQIVQDLAEVESLQPAVRCDAPAASVQRQPSSRAVLASTMRSGNITEEPCSAEKAPPAKEAAFELAPPAPRKPHYTNYAVPTTGQVVHFVTLALKSLLPRDVFGSLHNQNLILRTAGDFVRLRRYESFNLHQIAQSFRFADVDWALPPRATTRRTRRLSRHEEESRKKLVLELLYWLFDGLVIPLLRTTFYITETAAYRNKVLYFRQDDWHVLSRPVLAQLKESIFEPLTRAEALSMMSLRKLGYSHVRLLPKETGVRPIVNLRRRSTKQVHTEQRTSQSDAGKNKARTRAGGGSAKQRKESLILGQSINYILQSVFHILTYEKGRMLASGHGQDARGLESTGLESSADVLSSSVFGPNEIYTRLKTFKQRLAQDQARGGGAKKKLYFIKVDVRCAFDSIDQSKLLEIIERILSKRGGNGDHDADGYRIHRFAKVMPSSTTTAVQTNGTKREFVRLARPDTEHIDFFSLASSLAVALHDVVFVDSVAYRYESTSLVLQLLRQHITENLIKIGREFYRQRVGIPQGSSLSTLLCSFFYADMEASDAFLRGLATGGQNLLMRYTDDFLLITTSKRTARRFYQVMRAGHPEYGCFISPEKTLCNFDLLDTSPAAGPLIPRVYTDTFPWCGLTLHTRDLGVSTDLTRYAGQDMRGTLTVEYTRRPGAALVEKMIQSVKSRCHVLFTDTALNGSARVYANVYAGFLVAALKFAAYVGELRRFRVVFSAEFLVGAIGRLVRFTGRYIGSRAASASAKLHALGVRGAGKAGSNAIAKKRRGRAWKVSCTVQPRYVHWLGYQAFLAVLSPQAAGRKRHSEEAARNPNYRSLDADTRHALVGMLETCAKHPSFSAARRRLAPVVASTLKDARKSLHI